MQKYRKIVFVLLVVAMFALVGCVAGQESIKQAEAAEEVEDVEAVTAAINEIYSQYAASLNAGDAERWLSQWTDDGIQMLPGAPPNIGKEMIRTRVTGMVNKFTIDMEITNEEVGVAGDWAFARGTYTATFTPKAGGEAMFVDGKYMTVFERQPDGSWKIHRDIFNSNVPPN